MAHLTRQMLLAVLAFSSMCALLRSEEFDLILQMHSKGRDVPVNVTVIPKPYTHDNKLDAILDYHEQGMMQLQTF